MSDSVLDLLVWVLPFLLSLVSMLLTLEPLSQQSQRHKWKWRIGLAVFGATPKGSIAALGTHAITENGKGDRKNNHRRKRHPQMWPQVPPHLPRVPHTEWNAFFQIRFAILARDSPLTTRHFFFSEYITNLLSDRLSHPFDTA